MKEFKWSESLSDTDLEQDPAMEPAPGWLRELKISLALLTRVPVGLAVTPGAESVARAALYFPVIGVGVGLLGGALLALGLWLELPSALAALLALVAMTALTGALHEDGLADTCDGFGLRHGKEQTLAIMRDSQIGTFGVLGLIFGIGLRWGALTALAGTGPVVAGVALVAAATVSRAVLPAAMHAVPHAREDGLSVGAGRPQFTRAALAAIIGLAVAIGCFGFATAMMAVLGVVIVAVLILYWAVVRLDGQTGDVLGALQQVAEITVLVTAVASL